MFMLQKRLYKLRQHFLKPFFYQKAQFFFFFFFFCIFAPYKCSPNAYQIVYEETSNVSVSNGNIKCPIGKSIFAVLVCH